MIKVESAILFLVFNRLDVTKQVFEIIKAVKPPHLYIASDGARVDVAGEERMVQTIRDYIIDNIDWECKVKTLFRNKNLGCKHAVSQAISWFFEHEEMGVILEDDCLPDPSFFRFCDELLVKYANKNEVAVINGGGRTDKLLFSKSSYCFTKYPLIWGWASWRRVWQQYDIEMKDWSEYKHDIINSFDKKKTACYWQNAFDKTYQGQIDTWDYQFIYMVLKNNYKCIVPHKNLISNIGFSADATHTRDNVYGDANQKTFELDFPLIHPENFNNNISVDDFYDRYFSPIPFIKRVKRKILKIVKTGSW
jgi:hypothetical protein